MEERINKLEKITERLMRRAGKKVSAYITPYPISNAVFGDKLEGPILRYMFPCNGVITKGFVRIDKKPKGFVMLEIKMSNESGSTTKGFTVDKRYTFVEPNINISAGDCLEITLNPKEEIINEIWVAFLWRPTIKDIEVKSFLIEELEDDLQKRTKALTAE